jgi:hypothetical protein
VHRGNKTHVHIELEDGYADIELDHRFETESRKEFMTRMGQFWDWFHDMPLPRVEHDPTDVNLEKETDED